MLAWEVDMLGPSPGPVDLAAGIAHASRQDCGGQASEGCRVNHPASCLKACLLFQDVRLLWAETSVMRVGGWVGEWVSG
jgi:hypothetical protein